jgi:hypothetical protein
MVSEGELLKQGYHDEQHEKLRRLREENAKLRAFVEAFISGELRDGEFGYCLVCGARNFEAPHDPDCPWVLAKAYLG